jgi:hypothetical protein
MSDGEKPVFVAGASGFSHRNTALPVLHFNCDSNLSPFID